MDTAGFENYFNNQCDSIAIATRQSKVEEIYLEQILKSANFTNKRVEELNEMHRKGELTVSSQNSYVNDLTNQEKSAESK